MRVDGEPHFLVSFDSEGRVKRMGSSALSSDDGRVASGHLNGTLQRLLEAVPQDLLGRAGVYEDPGTTGPRCQWRVEFEGGSGPVRIDLTYHAGSAGLPPAIATLVGRAEELTESWYRKALADQEAAAAAPVPADVRVAQAGADSGAAVASGHAIQTIGDYLSFKGRIGRIDYIMLYGLPLTAFSFLGGFADGFVGLGTESQIGPMAAAATLISIWPGMAGWAKRLHDFDMSLWVVPGVILPCGVLIGIGVALSPWLGLAGAVIGGIAIVLLTVATYAWPGTKGSNRFGPAPIS